MSNGICRTQRDAVAPAAAAATPALGFDLRDHGQAVAEMSFGVVQMLPDEGQRRYSSGNAEQLLQFSGALAAVAEGSRSDFLRTVNPS